MTYAATHLAFSLINCTKVKREQIFRWIGLYLVIISKIPSLSVIIIVQFVSYFPPSKTQMLFPDARAYDGSKQKLFPHIEEPLCGLAFSLFLFIYRRGIKPVCILDAVLHKLSEATFWKKETWSHYSWEQYSENRMSGTKHSLHFYNDNLDYLCYKQDSRPRLTSQVGDVGS